MNRQYAGKHTARRALAVLLSLLMLLQSVSALAGSVDVPETNPAETISVPAETGDTSETPPAETGTADEKAPEDATENGPALADAAEIPAAGADEPAEIPGDSADTPDGNGGNSADNDGPEDDTDYESQIGAFVKIPGFRKRRMRSRQPRRLSTHLNPLPCSWRDLILRPFGLKAP